VFNYAACHEDVKGSGDVAPNILNFDTNWRLVVSFTNVSLYPEKQPRIGVWVGLRAGLVDVKKIILLLLSGIDSNKFYID
jgi:hypothetical protein